MPNLTGNIKTTEGGAVAAPPAPPSTPLLRGAADRVEVNNVGIASATRAIRKTVAQLQGTSITDEKDRGEADTPAGECDALFYRLACADNEVAELHDAVGALRDLLGH